jgi:hypothetical protein
VIPSCPSWCYKPKSSGLRISGKAVLATEDTEITEEKIFTIRVSEF